MKPVLRFIVLVGLVFVMLLLNCASDNRAEEISDPNIEYGSNDIIREGILIECVFADVNDCRESIRNYISGSPNDFNWVDNWADYTTDVRITLGDETKDFTFEEIFSALGFEEKE